MGILDEVANNLPVINEGALVNTNKLKELVTSGKINTDEKDIDDLVSIITKNIDDWNRERHYKKEDIVNALSLCIKEEIIGIRD